MADGDLGACVVLVPKETGLPVHVEGGAHATLAYFGDVPLAPELFNRLLDIVSDVADSLPEEVDVIPYGFDSFGEEGDAKVLTLFSGEESQIVLIRQQLLEKLDEDLARIFEESETFPDYMPHITLGYESEGYNMDKARTFQMPMSIEMDSIEVWNGEDRVAFKIGDDSLAHEGVIRRSGRYPWGSGSAPYQRSKDFLASLADLRKQGMTDKEISKALGYDSTKQLRVRISIESNYKRKADAAEAIRLKDNGYSNIAIGEKMDINESTVRSLLNPVIADRQNQLQATADMLKSKLSEDGYLDIGEGVENHIGVSKEKLATAAAILKEEGYRVDTVKVEQLGTGKETTVKVLSPPGTTYGDIVKNPERIKSIAEYSEDGGRTFLGIEPPVGLDSKRIGVRYADEGGADKDGVIELRRGVDDLSLGQARYAQVRIQVDETHYLKGMAMYSDNLPDGVDVVFNTNKKATGNKLDAMKNLKTDPDGSSDPDNPFGAVVRQKHYTGKDGKSKLSPINIVGSETPDGDSISGEEGGWQKWSKSLSSQMLSKQSPSLAKEQLGLAYDIKKAEFDEIMSYTNPSVKKKLLESFADDADSSSVNLKAAGLPRTANKVILPINSLKDNEVYAPTFRNGEKVVLIRHPHGGKFEIPELTVNNRNKDAKSVIENAIDAVGINSKVAARLSGADFDGDTVLVIPNNSGKIKTSPPLAALKNFDPQTYKLPNGEKFTGNKQNLMGNVSNLITDMTIRGANDSEIARAVKHYRVVIDAEKHNLNHKQSALDNNIKELKAKYQASDDGRTGASTLISRAKSQATVPDLKLRTARFGGPVDKDTGKLVYDEGSVQTYVDKNGKVKTKSKRTTKMAITDDAYKLSSGTPMEAVYADHANKLKALANSARKASVSDAVKPNKYSPSAKETYSKEVASLKAKLNLALKNKPLERQAQIVATTNVSAKRKANPNLDKDQVKKLKSQALAEARRRTGARKQSIQITPTEWNAIQLGAISGHMLNQILANTDLDLVKKYATPKDNPVMSKALTARAQAMLSSGYTQAEVADALGVPTSTLHDAISR